MVQVLVLIAVYWLFAAFWLDAGYEPKWVWIAMLPCAYVASLAILRHRHRDAAPNR